VTDIDPVRDLIIRAHGLANADEPYTIYYDETNNIRRLLVSPDGLNVGRPMCFVLGGIAHRGAVRALDMAELRLAVRLQPSAKELKLDHLGKGGFLQLLGSPKLAEFLRWLERSDLFIHYQAVDPLYWSTVDIIDSILADDELRALRMNHALLKNDLYTILRTDVAQVADLFHRYSYPDVGVTNRVAFMRELRDLLEHRRGLLFDFNFQMLKGILDIGVRGGALPYLQDETPNTLIDSFRDFFIERFTLFKNATHILDAEKTIEARLLELDLRVGDEPLRNYRFVDSKAEVGVQISDPVAGLMGKFLTYLNVTDEDALVAARAALSPSQYANLRTLNGLVDRAHAETPAFIHHVLSLTDMNRAAIFLDGC
jgi:hypothetical protein